MKKISSLIQIIVFCAFIGILSLLCVITPSRSFSEQENRNLEQAPEFSFSALFSGDFISKFEKYTTDQFVFRDSWIGIKSSSERLLGKTENNNVFFCADDTLITRFDEPDEKLIAMNIDAVNTLVENTDCDVYLSLIPGAVSIWADKLPENAQNCDQKELIENIYSRVNAQTIDIYSALKEHSEEYIYYRTDHHWTTLGAYYGYSATAEAMGLSPGLITDYVPRQVSDSFFGTVYSSSGVRRVSPDSIEIFVPEGGIEVTTYSDGAAAEGLVYDYSKLETKDKYSMFFGGNTPLLEIKTAAAEKPRLLVIRDSYSDCELPFLFNDYSEIHVLDLRYYKLSVSDYISQNGIDTVLVNYSVSNFSSDVNISLAGR